MYKVKSPILFLVFNRLETTKQVFETIKISKPPKLYIASDGPRKFNKSDKNKVDEVRDFIDSNINWDCEVKTLYRDKNLGCKVAVSNAIDWFFGHEEMGIILEDDVVPNRSFFEFVDHCLRKYKADSRVMMITGTNYLSQPMLDEPYFFSEHATIWGWATWKRSWNLYDVTMKEWQNKETKSFFKLKYSNSFIWKHYRNTFNSLQTSYIDTWDIQWVFTFLNNHGLCITPKVNLISNVGVIGAHSNGVTDSNFMATHEISHDEYSNFKPNVRLNYSYDLSLYNKKIKKAVLISEIIHVLKKIYLYKFLRFFKKLLKL